MERRSDRRTDRKTGHRQRDRHSDREKEEQRRAHRQMSGRTGWQARRRKEGQRKTDLIQTQIRRAQLYSCTDTRRADTERKTDKTRRQTEERMDGRTHGELKNNTHSSVVLCWSSGSTAILYNNTSDSGPFYTPAPDAPTTHL